MGLLLPLKTFQRLGNFIRYIDIPAAIISHIARSAGYQDVPEGFESYDASSARGRHMMLVRNFVDVTAYGYAARKVASLRAVRTREDLADIINVALEELARQRYELPGFGTLLKIAGAARSRVNCEYQRTRLRNAADYCQAEAVWHFDPSFARAARLVGIR